jgi:hypothetical protein
LKKSHVIFCLPLLLVISCSNDSNTRSKATPQPVASERKSLLERMDEKNGYTQSEDGSWVPKNDKRSSFETNRESAYFKGDYNKKEFKTKDVSKKSWWGNTKYESKKFEGNLDGNRFRTASNIRDQGPARETGSAARETGNYRTGNYATSTATESGATRLDRPSDAETDARRRVYTAPSVIDWREQRALSVGQTNGMLGK